MHTRSTPQRTPTQHTTTQHTHPQAPPTGQAAPGSPHTHTHTPRSCTRKGSQPPRRYNAPLHAAAATGHTQGQQTARQRGTNRKGEKAGQALRGARARRVHTAARVTRPLPDLYQHAVSPYAAAELGSMQRGAARPTPRTLGVGVYACRPPATINSSPQPGYPSCDSGGDGCVVLGGEGAPTQQGRGSQVPHSAQHTRTAWPPQSIVPSTPRSLAHAVCDTGTSYAEERAVGRRCGRPPNRGTLLLLSTRAPLGSNSVLCRHAESLQAGGQPRGHAGRFSERAGRLHAHMQVLWQQTATT